jgi:hypothetical protein
LVVVSLLEESLGHLLLVEERLLLEQQREQGTFAQPFVVPQQEELVAAERMWLQ